MDINSLIDAAERLKQGLLAKATDGEYPDQEYQRDRGILSSDSHVDKLLPRFVRANRSTADFRRSMQAQYQHYSERRQAISEQLNPLFDYLESVKSGNDAFTHNPLIYEAGKQLGKGGFGEVFKYHHKLLDMDFAVKIFEPMFVSNEENIKGEKRFFREAKILFKLNNDHIVRVYDIGRVHGKPFIRMEYIDGQTMQDFVSQHGTVSFERSKKPIIALLHGLSYAHKMGVIHRDLKPSNFMVTRDGRFVIIDFGISAFLETDKHTKLTKTGEQVVGGSYTDPMLMEDPKLRDVRSDIYSVGAIWYYLLVGHSPMGGDIKNNILNSSTITELQCGIIMKCLSSKIEDRYQSCDEILSILEPVTNQDAPYDVTSQYHITEVTRDAIFEYLKNRHEDEEEAYVSSNSSILFQQPEKVFSYSGRRNDVDFLNRLYDLRHMKSMDSRAHTFEQEIKLHTITFPGDYPYGWVFDDDRLGLNAGDDETLLKFLCMMFHPLVRSEETDWAGVLEDINKLLKEDGYEIYASEKISGKSVYSYKMLI